MPLAGYPPAAFAACAQGVTIVSVDIDSDGTVKDVAIVKSSGNTELDDASKKRMLDAHWTPATREGQPVESSKEMKVTWHLDGCTPAATTTPDSH